MKLDRANNAVRNLKFGVIQKMLQILCPFLMRTVMLHTLGVEYLGLNSLFVSILQVLNLAELGVGNAMVYSMYEPIVRDDTGMICALLGLYRTYYRIIGLVVAGVGALITPFVPALIHGEVPAGNSIFVLYWLNLAATVLSYWLFAYKNSLILAHQRTDIASKISIFTVLFQNVLQLLILVFWKNYVAFLVTMLVFQALNNIITAVTVRKVYPDYKPMGRLEREQLMKVNHRIRDLVTAKIGAVIVNDADTLVISAFLGLTALAAYQNYFYILTAVVAMVSILFSSCMAGVGNSLITETREKNYRDLKLLTFILLWVSCVCTGLLMNLYQPFVQLWMGEELVLPFRMVIAFCIYYFVYELNQLFIMFKDAGGIWHRDRFRPMATAFANLMLNLLLVQCLGLYGVIFSTVISFLVLGMPWLLHNLFHELFEPRSLWPYLRCLAGDILVVFAAVGITYLCCLPVHLTGWAELIAKGLVSGLVSNGFLLLAWHKRPELRTCFHIILKKGNKG